MSLLTQSYVHGASSTPLLGETIGALLRRIVAEGPDRPALVTRHQNVRLSYADLLRRSEDLAVGLKTLGLEKGDRVGIWSPNNSEWVLAQFGTALAGLLEDAIDQLRRKIGAAGEVSDSRVAVQLVQHETHVAERRLVGLHAVSLHSWRSGRASLRRHCHGPRLRRSPWQ